VCSTSSETPLSDCGVSCRAPSRSSTAGLVCSLIVAPYRRIMTPVSGAANIASRPRCHALRAHPRSAFWLRAVTAASALGRPVQKVCLRATVGSLVSAEAIAVTGAELRTWQVGT
jgi:hypothetical protein